MNIADFIAKGEGQTREFKNSLSLRRQALDALCAMVNADTAQGTVIFGVAPDGTVSGVEDGNMDSAQRSLTQAIITGFDPPLQPQVEIAQLSGKTLVVLTARRLPSVPYHEYEGRAWIRQGSENRRLGVSEKDALQKKRNRSQHLGPWKCDRCGRGVGQLIGVKITESGMERIYDCSCSGEFWPCT